MLGAGAGAMRDDFFHRKTFKIFFRRNLRGGAGGGFTADTGAKTMGTARPPRNLLTSSADRSAPGLAGEISRFGRARCSLQIRQARDRRRASSG